MLWVYKHKIALHLLPCLSVPQKKKKKKNTTYLDPCAFQWQRQIEAYADKFIPSVLAKQRNIPSISARHSTLYSV